MYNTGVIFIIIVGGGIDNCHRGNTELDTCLSVLIHFDWPFFTFFFHFYWPVQMKAIRILSKPSSKINKSLCQVGIVNGEGKIKFLKVRGKSGNFILCQRKLTFSHDQHCFCFGSGGRRPLLYLTFCIYLVREF